MGKSKPKNVRRTSNALLEKGVKFSEDFEENKKILARNMPSKKLRNQIAGLLVRIKKQERLAKPKID
ncbi:MAG: 30S ribosomal protein S17e [Candidatus Pacearchaeota archaeon]|nr:30S ribosomal protein S17e [Candidatus Pacearchaeota archaeon]